MRLPYGLENLQNTLSTPQVALAVRERRRVIREHRDEKLDDRCWLDDYRVWIMLGDSPTAPPRPASLEEGMKKCREYYFFRRSDTVDPIPSDAITDPAY
jgi:hypothetical protein